MATSVINDKQRMFIRKTYSGTVSVASDGRHTISASAFGITDIPGYSIVGVWGAYSGSTNVNVRAVTPTTSGTVMRVYNKSGSGVSGSITATVKLTWMRNDLIGS